MLQPKNDMIADNFARWIICQLYDELSEIAQNLGANDETTIYRAKVAYKRVEQIQCIMSRDSWEIIAQVFDYEISFIRMMATCERVYDVI